MSGAWFWAIAGAMALPPAPVDQPGTLTPNVTQQGRNYVFASVLSDPDGIRSITASSVTSGVDGQTANTNWTRSDANTFTHAANRRNPRWARGSMTVTYVEASTGEARTITALWSA